MPRYLFQGQGDSQGQLGPTLQKLADRAEFSNTKRQALESLFDLAAPMAMYSPEAEGATMFHGSPKWWKDLLFKDEFLKTGEKQMVKGSGHYTTGSPEYAWDLFVDRLGGLKRTRGNYPVPADMSSLTLDQIKNARRDAATALGDMNKAEQYLAQLKQIKKQNPKLTIDDLYENGLIPDDLSGFLYRTDGYKNPKEYTKSRFNYLKQKLDNIKSETGLVDTSLNAHQGNILTVNTKRPLSEYVNYEGLVSADPTNANKLYSVVRQNDLAKKIYGENAGHSWADMIKGLEHPFGEKGASEILQSSGIAGNIHPNQFARTQLPLENITASDVGGLVRSGEIDPALINAVTINPNDLQIVSRKKSLQDLYSDLPGNWKQTWR